MPDFRIKHITRYTYIGNVTDNACQIILFPVKDKFQEVIKHDLHITHEPSLEIYTDYYGNRIGTFCTSGPLSELTIDSQVLVKTKAKDLPSEEIAASKQWEKLQEYYKAFGFIDFLKRETFAGMTELENDLKMHYNIGDTPFHLARKCCRYVYENYNYIPGITTVESTLENILELKAGVCQDFAHVLSEMLRIASIPARYVSGYICPNKNGYRGVGATHAWVEAFIPDYGWIGLDPTNNCIAQEMHVRLAVGRNFSDCSPVKGVYKGHPDHKLEVSVTVSYGDSPVAENSPEIVKEKINQDFPINSFQRHLELTQQQQQQQQ